MAKFRVSGDIRVAFVIEVDAESQDEAERRVSEMRYGQIDREGNIDTGTAGVEVQDSEEIELTDETKRPIVVALLNEDSTWCEEILYGTGTTEDEVFASVCETFEGTGPYRDIVKFVNFGFPEADDPRLVEDEDEDQDEAR